MQVKRKERQEKKPKENTTPLMQRRLIMQVEEQVMTAYIDSKSRQLDQVLHSFFQEDMALWPQAPPPTQLRDVCLEVLFSLVSIGVSTSHMLALALLAIPQLHELQALKNHVIWMSADLRRTHLIPAG